MDISLNNLILTFKGNTRGAKAKRQIVYSFFIQILSVLIGLLYVPLLLDFLTQEKYGIWITLTSILGWFSFFDIGLGNGLRNKLAEALAKGNKDLGKKYISTTYAILIGIFSVVLVVFHLSNFFLNWNSILNTKTIDNSELYVLTSIVFTFFIFRFIVQLISVIYLADQKPSATKMMNTGGNLVAFIIVLILTRLTLKGDLVLLGTIISAVPVLLFVVVSITSFNTRYKALKPSVKAVDFKLSNGLINLGAKFFFLQIAYIVVFSTSNIFITQFYGPGEVAVYNVAFKYFQIPVMVFSIVMSPIWSAVTDAYTKSDYGWMKRTLKQLNVLSLLFIAGIVLMVGISDWIYGIWVGDKITVPFSLSVTLGIYSCLQIFVAPYSSFINGIGKLKLTLSLTFVGIATYLILIYVFGNIFKNSTGIVLAIICTHTIGAVIQPTQTYKLLNKTAKGIWNK
ncbi:polysaccharide biosynthesis protein [Mariniphaga sediminis]|uniref:Polysaccharide biosynthesis protein n=1 Tax=Mariniphaga sediminis TaxID=1628158 RepID=A0A399D2K1_9BACT|nr:oligosaccharide flippase family protein [Mariniphaga sediminis]RIH65703.1 polysaccharide biosynthesis protein [Mariniphaga sediminis]